jgi:hypothetical protein
MYKECTHWTNQIISAIETKFPSSLQSKRNRFDGFPLSFTSQDAINLVAESVNKEIPRRQAHCDIQLAVLTKVFKYTRDDSTIEFLKDMEKEKHHMDILDCGGLAYDNLIVHCLAAFRNSHLPTDKTRSMETSWNKSEEQRKQTAGHDISDTARWGRFKTHYIAEINDLKDDGLLQSGKAHRVTEERLEDLESRFNLQDRELDEINNNQYALDTAFRAIRDVPSMIGTAPGTPSAMSTNTNTQLIVDIVNRAFEAHIAELKLAPQDTSVPPTQRNTGRPGTPAAQTAPNTDVWRQWKFWCYSHGANLRHDSPGCDHPRDGHKMGATKDNPMGGNTKRDHLWGQWCSPVDHKPYTTPN